MSSLRHPVGPQPPSVYWRRRAVVGLGLLAVIIVIILIVVRPGTADTGSEPAPDPAASEGAEAPAEGEGDDLDQAAEDAGAAEDGASGTPGACSPEQVQVTPVTDADAYSPESTPQLSLTLVNTGANPCIIEAGSDVQEFIITSGPDRIWSSRDCQVDPVAASVVLEPGEERATTPIPWNRTRSEPGVCDVERQAVTAGGATYRLSVAVGEFAGDGDRPFILN